MDEKTHSCVPAWDCSKFGNIAQRLKRVFPIDNLTLSCALDKCLLQEVACEVHMHDRGAVSRRTVEDVGGAGIDGALGGVHEDAPGNCLKLLGLDCIEKYCVKSPHR